MTRNEQDSQDNLIPFIEEEFEGIYGHYRITRSDQIEVQRYRLALLVCGVAFTAGIIHWLVIGPTWAWLWFIPMEIGLGLALNWIHIYLRPLHRALQVFWALGCLGTVLIALRIGAPTMLSSIATDPSWLWAIGPLFAALTGVGFKEFFCFRRLEAIGLTVLVPISLLGHLSGLVSKEIVISMLGIASVLLLILSLRKFGMNAAADVGDKSVFNYLDNKQTAGAL